MNLEIFSIYDSAVEAYMPPFTQQSKGAAIRAFTDTVQDESTTLSRHPEDFTLFYIGSWDEATASITQDNTPFALVKGNEIVQPHQEIE